MKKLKKSCSGQSLALLFLAGLLAVSVSSAQTLTATAVAPQQVNLTWGTITTRFEVFLERRTNVVSNQFNEIAKLTATELAAQAYQDKTVSSSASYTYRIRYTSGDIAAITRYTAEATVTTPEMPPPAPTNLTLSDMSVNQISLTWSWQGGKDAAAIFVIERSVDGGKTFSAIKVTEYKDANFRYTDTGLAAGTNYCYRVKARNSGGDSGYSNAPCASTAQGAPGAPSALIAKANLVFQIQLNWIDGSGNEDGFEIERSTDNFNFTKIATTAANTTQYLDGPLTPGQRYYYRVRAFNRAGTSSYTNVANDITNQSAPSAPESLSARTAGTTQIDLNWLDTASNEDGFEIERSQDGSSFSKIADLGANSTSYQSQGLIPATRYWYRVRAKNSGGTSRYSNVAEATTNESTPNAPQNLSASPFSNTQINLNWSDNASNETGFEIERSTDGDNFTKIADVAANTSSYQSIGLATLTTYVYRVRAKNGVGNSEYSNKARATTFDVPPAAPSSLAASTISSSQIDLSWTDNAANESGFDVERSADGNNFSKIGETAANTISFQSTGLNPATRYWYRIRSRNSQGASAPSNVADATTKDVVPNTPQNLAATPVSNQQINLSWTDNSSNETGFEIERSPDGNTFAKIADLAANVTAYQSTGLATLTTYVYRIRAKNAIGFSEYSGLARATTYDVPPATPESLSATTISSSQINLAWKDVSANETGFELERSLNGTDFSRITDLDKNTTTYQNTGLASATKYWYRIRAVNTANPSTYSNIATATTLDVAPSAPTNLTAKVIDYAQIDLSWTDQSGNEAGFQIERSLDGTTFLKIADVAANVTTYQSKGLSSLTKYYYRVRAVNAIGASAYSNIADASTPRAPIPDIPKNLTAIPLDFDLIQLRWSALSANAAEVVIERSTKPDKDFVQIGKQSAGIIEFPDREILDVADYYYRIKATNSAGSSAYSDVATVFASSIITGTEPVALENQIYTHNKILYVKLSIPGKAVVTLYDLRGVRQRQFLTSHSSETNLHSLSDGIYIVVVEADKQLFKQKILVD